MTSSPSGAVKVGLAAVLAIAVTGYFVGLHQTRTSKNAPVPEAWTAPNHNSPEEDTPLVASYSELPLREQRWESTLASLPRAEGSVPKKPANTKHIFDAIRERSTNRAFAGAPPSIPHPIASMGDQVCLSCHQQSMQIGERITRQMSHPLYVNCSQCHVENANPKVSGSEFASLFEGLSETRGDRSFWGAPPTIPHPMWMRENCQSCHGPTGPQALRTTHPERQLCTQCHVTPQTGVQP